MSQAHGELAEGTLYLLRYLHGLLVQRVAAVVPLFLLHTDFLRVILAPYVEGEIVGEFKPKEVTVNELGLYMAGIKRDVEVGE